MIRNARDKRSNTVAYASGISAPMYSLIESGDRQPSTETLQSIATALDVPIEVFLIIQDVKVTNKHAKSILMSLYEIDHAEELLRELLERGS